VTEQLPAAGLELKLKLKLKAGQKIELFVAGTVVDAESPLAVLRHRKALFGG
jgi:hypothetical protein